MLIGHKNTGFGRFRQPNSVGKVNYRIRMPKKDPKLILWENVSTLMSARYGKENLGKLATEAGVGPATMTRLKQAETSTGIDNVASIAAVFKLQPWQLLVSGLTASAPPRLANAPEVWPFPSIDRTRFESLQPEQKIEIQGVVRKMVSDFENESHSTMRNKSHGVIHPPYAGGNIVQTTIQDTELLARTSRDEPSDAVSHGKKKGADSKSATSSKN